MTFSKILLGCFLAGSFVEGAPIQKSAQQPQLKAAATLRGAAAPVNAAADQLGNATALHAIGKSQRGMACQCDLAQQSWTPSVRTTPKCIFIDLGAANGNTLKDFIAGAYGPLANCPSGGQWEATLVEANPRFSVPLKQAEATYPANVRVGSSTARAAYMCEAQTTFYLDTQSHENNYWGSSMSANHVDAQKSGHTAVTVPTINILKTLYETTIPSDYVILKMDIEGAEWDVLPCLAKSPTAHLVDRLMVEVHPQNWGNAGTTQPQLDASLAALRAKGVDIPNGYHSQTL